MLGTFISLTALTVNLMSGATGINCAAPDLKITKLCWGCLDQPYIYTVDPPGILVGSTDPSIKHIARKVTCETGATKFILRSWE